MSGEIAWKAPIVLNKKKYEKIIKVSDITNEKYIGIKKNANSPTTLKDPLQNPKYFLYFSPDLYSFHQNPFLSKYFNFTLNESPEFGSQNYTISLLEQEKLKEETSEEKVFFFQIAPIYIRLKFFTKTIVSKLCFLTTPEHSYFPFFFEGYNWLFRVFQVAMCLQFTQTMTLSKLINFSHTG